ncbi:GNAT family N-acetyltransferase [Nocardioides panaciterrulae]|uniref:Putative GNAT superfamily acetyltransferase n=1 Tax=Nocardioides panaciterrulae TaxID=661492 RepID=A0A7Y9E9K3_9ACTN|nr:GNAT family N-acetyltransferase [Nocardioides panaciterrulae]NYD43744.1 putative GNAT superfamily acetyltransferase [Nocardioides panaciterrulae]
MTTQAWASYDAAAVRARVAVRELSGVGELQEAAAVLGRIWGVPDNPPMSAELLRAMGKAESYVAGAYDADRPDGAMVGVCVGFHSTPAARTMHSHIAGVTPAVAGRHAGFALKLHQRAWCLDRGIELMEWTYDPLVSRNAYFNLAKLGARVAEYLPDFYGAMTDGINRHDESDRILVHWSLATPEVDAACAGTRVRAVVPSGAAASWVHVPRDIEALRLADPEQARGWRTKVRDQLLVALQAGGRVAGFDKEQGYLVLPYEGDACQ